MIRNTAGQSAGAQIINAGTGAAFAGTVTVYVTIDNGTETIGSVASGICTAKGNGYYTYNPSQAETNGAVIAFTFVGSGAIPATVQYPTITTSQTAALAGVPGSGTSTIGDTLTAILQDLGIIEAGASISAADMALALDRCNAWIDGLATQGLTIYTITRTTWTLTTAASYTVGAGGTVNIARPVGPQAIRNIGFQDTAQSPVQEYLIGSPLTEDAYAALPQKAMTSVYPQFWYYNATFPLGTLRPFPIPTSSTLQGVLYSETPVSQFAAITDSFVLPPGYKRFFRSNCALEIAPAFRVAIPPSLAAAAAASTADVKRANIRLSDLSLDPGAFCGRGSPTYNIWTGP